MTHFLSVSLPVDKINIKYVPDDEELVTVRKIGNKLGKIALA